MRILFLSTWFPFPPDNGSKTRVYHLLQALGRQHEVTLVSFAWDGGPADRPKGPADRPEGPADVGEDMPFCRTVHVCRRDPFARSALALATRYVAISPVVARPIPEMQRLVERTLAETPFDAVIASTEGMATYALQAPADTVKILEEHNAYARMMEDRYRAASRPAERLNHWVSWRKARIYEARLFRKFTQVVMVSEQDRAISAQLAGRRVPVAVVPNGVDCTHHRPGLAEATPNTLIYNGALTYSANYDAVFPCGDLFGDSRNDTRCYILHHRLNARRRSQWTQARRGRPLHGIRGGYPAARGTERRLRRALANGRRDPAQNPGSDGVGDTGRRDLEGRRRTGGEGW